MFPLLALCLVEIFSFCLNQHVSCFTNETSNLKKQIITFNKCSWFWIISSTIVIMLNVRSISAPSSSLNMIIIIHMVQTFLLSQYLTPYCFSLLCWSYVCGQIRSNKTFRWKEPRFVTIVYKTIYISTNVLEITILVACRLHA